MSRLGLAAGKFFCDNRRRKNFCEEAISLTKTVIGERFRSVFIASIASMAISYVLILTDNIVAGQFVDDEAVAAMTLISPIMTLVLFLSYMVSDGLAMMFSYAKGRNDQQKANELFGMGAIVTALTGVAMTIILIAFREQILSMWEISPHMMIYADDYYQGLMFVALPCMLNIYFYTIYVAEGEENICVKASVAMFVVNVVLDVVLGFFIGVIGIGIATVVGNLVSFLFHVPYLFSENCQLKFVRYFDLRELCQGIFYSWYHSMDTLCLALLPIIFSEFVIFRFGESHLIVVSVINNMLTLLIAIYTGIVDCLQPMVCQYHAEGALHSVTKTMRLGIKSAVAVTLIIILFSLIFAEFLPGLFGVGRSEPIYFEAVHAVRIFMPFTVFLGVTLMLGNYYIYVERLNLGAEVKLLLLLILPSAGMSAGFFGMQMMWIGVGVSFIVALIVTRLLTRKEHDLLLIDAEKISRQFSLDIPPKFESRAEFLSAVEKFFARINFDDGRKNFLTDIAAQVFDVYAAQSEKFQLEVSIIPAADKTTLIFRDNGPPRSYDDITLKNVREKNYMISGDENKLVVVA